MSAKILSGLDKFNRIRRRLGAPEYFGFVSGHEWVSQKQAATMEGILAKDQDGDVVRQYERKFSALIGDGYGQSFLAGRMAFYSLLKALNISHGDEVILTAFTCSVMPNAVWRSGATPIFVDIDPDTFGPDPEDINRKITKNTKMIVAQHSFGIPCRIDEIIKIAQERSIFVLEDSALALDSSRDGIKTGNWGDAAFFSTDHTKPLNTMVGGFFYTRNRSLFEQVQAITKDMPSLDRAHQQRIYDQFLFERKYFSPQKFGRSVIASKLRSLKKKGGVFLELDYFRKPPSEYNYPYPARMPAFLAQLGLFELERWDGEKKLRQGVLKEYIQFADTAGLSRFLPASYLDKRNEIVPLRFAICVPRAEEMKKALRNFLDTQQIWFQSTVICCPEGPESLGYVPGSCPVAETTSKSVINWPCVLTDRSKGVFLTRLKNIL